jgi:hypothetical protein
MVDTIFGFMGPTVLLENSSAAYRTRRVHFQKRNSNAMPPDKLLKPTLRIEGAPIKLTIRANAYRTDGPWMLEVRAQSYVSQRWSHMGSNNWYDFTVCGDNFERRFAGRAETGQSSFSNPAE